MKSKYVSTNIKRQEKFLKNLFNDFIQDDGFICGGFARYCLEEKDPIECGDIDIYCKNIEAFERIKTRLEANLYVSDKISPIAISFKNAFKGKYPIQLIKPMDQGYIKTSNESIEVVLNNFDFTVIRAGIFLLPSVICLDGDLSAIVDEDFFKDKNRLVIKNIHCPVAEFYRVSKYFRKGFAIATLEIIKILEDWQNRPTSYKIDLIEKLKKENPSQEDIDKMEALLHVD